VVGVGLGRTPKKTATKQPKRVGGGVVGGGGGLVEGGPLIGGWTGRGVNTGRIRLGLVGCHEGGVGVGGVSAGGQFS